MLLYVELLMEVKGQFSLTRKEKPSEDSMTVFVSNKGAN